MTRLRGLKAAGTVGGMSKTRIGVAVVVVIAAFGLAGCSSAAQAPAVAPASTPTAGSALDEESACVALIPVLQDGATAILAISQQPDGSTVDQVKLGETIRALQGLQLKVPESMRQDVGDQIDALVALRHVLSTAQNQQLDFQAFRTSGLTLGATCLKYGH